MKNNITIYIEDNRELWNTITPDFIYNRFDLFEEGKKILIKVVDSNTMYIPILINGNKATLGIWGLEIPYAIIKEIADWVFQKYSTVYQIYVQRPLIDNNHNYKMSEIKNDVFVILPKTSEELDLKLSSKGRYNIKREKRIISEEFGKCILNHVVISDPNAEELTKKYFELKYNSMGSLYNLTPREYWNKYNVTDIYYMNFGKDTTAILMSCEQCSCVYLENLSYDIRYAKYSPGQVAYDFYLKNLIQKGKKQLFLLGGNYDYKKRYGSIERMVVEYIIVRKSYKGLMIYGKKFLIACFNLLPHEIKDLYIRHQK